MALRRRHAAARTALLGDRGDAGAAALGAQGTSAPRRRARRLGRRWLLFLVALAALAAAGATVYARRGSTTVEYRTAQAALGTVTQTLSLSGNLAPRNPSNLDFATSGRVQSVAVQPGQRVSAGQTLASLDTSALQAALTQAQANLTSAQARLSLDESAPTAQSLASAEAQVASAQVGLQNAQQSLADTVVINDQSVAQAQQAVVTAQTLVTADEALVSADRQKAQADQSNSTAEASDQQRLAADQQALAKDESSLSAAQANVQMAAAKAQQVDDQARAQVATAQVQLTNAADAVAALRQGTQPQTIQQDQSSVQVAQINVDSAQRALGEATLTAPVDGTVGAVNVAVGQSVSGGASSSSSTSSSSAATHQVVILTLGAFDVTGAVTDTQVNLVAVGQRARVTPAGAQQAINGRVTQVDNTATVTSGVATFGVTVALDGANPSLHAGVSASVQVIVNQAVEVVTVPTSAVQNGTVQVMVDGQPQTRPVAVGIVDALRTQIVSGVSVGDTVVIATVTSAVPTQSSNGGNGGGGLLGPGGGGGGRGGRAPGG